LHARVEIPSPLCVICDDDVCRRNGWTLDDFASACLQGGARFLQIRGKQLPASRLLEISERIVDRAKASAALVVVNDRADIARIAGAGGVHVGQDDLPPSAVRAIVGNTVVIGFSTHTIPQIAAAVTEPIDYLAIGPVFATSTKAAGYDPVGTERVREAAEAAHRMGLPVVAIGGITLDRAADVLRAGANAVAVIADLLSDGNPEERVRQYLSTLAKV
jgi:thiamine-phosphate pyrophosphorylase